ncbi:hybrid sensor histidine kinase/response regulator [Celeribacter ethanolicus]|uniref:hybrid sensor histidine kinase/response regulator n=1 Tax=Celeribacter ethanolicus TaxID=1758178 RepID=UPI00082ED7C8|nr:hybrid sensor histidine kinase/response regulator [Celeribacter ethanolicus]
MTDSPPPDKGQTPPETPAAALRDTNEAQLAAQNATRPVLQTIARMIATDRRPAALLSETAKLLLANAAARQLGLSEDVLRHKLDWPLLCQQALRAGSVALSLKVDATSHAGELVHLPLNGANGFLLRLAETEQESTWLENRARAATLLRVAHDLRTPIQSLLATADAVLDTTGDSPRQDIGTTRAQLHASAERALDHINNVLAVIRGEQSASGLQQDEDFCLMEEIRAILAMIFPIAKTKQTEIRVRFEPAEDIWVNGPVRFVRALCQNIFDNAVKHGGPRVEITVRCEALFATPAPDAQTGWRIVLDVQDLGGGLPDDQKLRLRRALGPKSIDLKGQEETGEPPSTPPERTSAGLNVLAHALHQLGGRITVRDRYRNATEDSAEHAEIIGTTITASFDLNWAEPRLKTEPEKAGATTTLLRGISVLLVEDSPSSRDWLTHILRKGGATVYAAGNGMEALALLAQEERQKDIDLILTDMTLPFMSGVELARRIREKLRSGRLKWSGSIVGLTAHIDARIRKACQEAGIVRVLDKPIRPQLLLKALKDVTESTKSQTGTCAPAVPTQESSPPSTCGILALDTVHDLTDQLGVEGTKSFMLRAHEEARAILESIREDGITADTGRRLHAATGACGLTGLAAIEKNLRALELAVDERRSNLNALAASFENALDSTFQAIEEISSRPQAQG